MNKNKIQIAITIGVMCSLLTTSIIIQVNTIKKNSITNTTRSSNNGLRDQVLEWKEKYERVFSELQVSEDTLESVRQSATKDNDNFTKIDEELKNTNALLGLTDLTGEGVIITVADNDSASISDEDISSELVHNTDLIEIVNELKNTKAEAISINGQRVISTTDIKCVGAVITVNGEKINSPFVISAIGNKELLNGITRPGSYIGIMQEDGIKVIVEKVDEVKIPKYNKVLTTKHMTTKK